jgi:hypothetical protein
LYLPPDLGHINLSAELRKSKTTNKNTVISLPETAAVCPMFIRYVGVSINELLQIGEKAVLWPYHWRRYSGEAEEYHAIDQQISSNLAYSTCLLVFPPFFQSHTVTVGSLSLTTLEFFFLVSEINLVLCLSI